MYELVIEIVYKNGTTAVLNEVVCFHDQLNSILYNAVGLCDEQSIQVTLTAIKEQLKGIK